MLVNDDVLFETGAVEKMLEKCKSVLVGAVTDSAGDLSYGGVCYKKGTIKYEIVGPNSACGKNVIDTFNANCVLIERKVFLQADSIDEHYVHSLGDFDYGLALHRKGVPIEIFEQYVGVCPDNSIKGTWQDCSLGRRKRFQLKEAPKGAPLSQWFYFLKKNFGLGKALLHTFTPYIRILIGK